MPFIEDFLETYKEAESPTQFLYWAAITSISAVVRKNIYINKRLYKLYPNLYVMFVARSGLRKGYPVKQAQKVVEATEAVKVISGQNSIQAIVKRLSKSWTLESGKLMKDAQALITNDELDSLLINDPSAQTILTTLYDSFYHESKWTKDLKEEETILQHPHISMLTASNPVHLDSFLDKTSVTGGFLGRTLVVYASKRSKINPLIDENDIIEVDIKPLVEQLKKISEIVGQFKFSRAAVNFYKPWYEDFSRRSENLEFEDDTGYIERAGDTVLKLSMILSVNESPELLIEEKHLKKSIELFYKASEDAKLVFAGKGKSESSDKNRTVLSYLLSRENNEAFRQQILAARYGDITANELSEVVDTLTQAGLLETILDKEKGPLYRLTEKWANKLKNKLEGKR